MRAWGREKGNIMALFYKVVRDNRIDSDHLFYARAVHSGAVSTDDLAEIIQRNCSMKKSDVLAVLTELVEVMTDQLQASKTVKLDGLGSFKLGIRSFGADTEDKYSVTKHVAGLRVRFLAEGKRDMSTNKVVRTFLNGCTLQKYNPTPAKKA